MKISLITLTLLIAGCASAPKSSMTPLQVQSLQSRSFESTKEIVFPSVVSVFQDLGYNIKSADAASGFINAESAADSNAWTKALFNMSQVKQTKATGFIEQIGNTTRVRLNFLASNSTSTAYGRNDKQETPILNSEVYQTAFEKIENAIFIRSASQ